LNDILVELDTGIFSGLEAQEAERRYPELMDEFYRRSWDAIPGAESSQSLYARAILAWQRVRELGEQGAQSIVCVTHGGLLQWMLRATLGVHSWLPLLPVANCGISHYEIGIIGKEKPVFAQWKRIDFHLASLIEE